MLESFALGPGNHGSATAHIPLTTRNSTNMALISSDTEVETTQTITSPLSGKKGSISRQNSDWGTGTIDLHNTVDSRPSFIPITPSFMKKGFTDSGVSFRLQGREKRLARENNENLAGECKEDEVLRDAKVVCVLISKGFFNSRVCIEELRCTFLRRKKVCFWHHMRTAPFFWEEEKDAPDFLQRFLRDFVWVESNPIRPFMIEYADLCAWRALDQHPTLCKHSSSCTAALDATLTDPSLQTRPATIGIVCHGEDGLRIGCALHACFHHRLVENGKMLKFYDLCGNGMVDILQKKKRRVTGFTEQCAVDATDVDVLVIVLTPGVLQDHTSQAAIRCALTRSVTSSNATT